MVTFSIERHVLLREFFFLFSDLACFFILKLIQAARLICTSLVQKKQSKLVVPASQIHVTSVFRIATSSSPTSSLPRSQLQEKDYSFLTIVASSNGYKRREQISLSLSLSRSRSLSYHAHAHWIKRRAPESFLFDAVLKRAWVWRRCAPRTWSTWAALAGCYLSLPGKSCRWPSDCPVSQCMNLTFIFLYFQFFKKLKIYF